MKNILTVTHRADFDGLCSREIARKVLGESSDYLGFDYGDPIPDLAPYQTVYLIDISLPVDVMRANASKLIIIDHHKTLIGAVESFKSEFKGYYCIDGVAACRLAWQYFHCPPICPLPEKQRYIEREVIEPYAVQLLGEYDIWDKRNPHVDPFQLGILAEGNPNWDVLFGAAGIDKWRVDHYIETLIDNGRTIQRFAKIVNAQIIQERGFDAIFEGRTFRALNIARCNSLTFTAAIKPHHEGCLGYYWNGKHWKFSLYQVEHRKDIDLSVIASKYGGGGHAGACGFQLDELPREFGGAPRDHAFAAQ